MFGSQDFVRFCIHILTSSFPKELGSFEHLKVEVDQTKSCRNTCHGVISAQCCLLLRVSLANAWHLCTWRKVMNTSKKKILSKRKYHIWISCTFPRPRCNPSFETCSVPIIQNLLSSMFHNTRSSSIIHAWKIDPMDWRVKRFNKNCSNRISNRSRFLIPGKNWMEVASSRWLVLARSNDSS